MPRSGDQINLNAYDSPDIDLNANVVEENGVKDLQLSAASEPTDEEIIEKLI